MFFTERYASLMVAFLLFGMGIAQADEQDIIGFSGNSGTNGGANCTVCHAPSGSKPIVTLTGPTLVQAGQTNTYTVTLQGGPGITAGVNISSSGPSGILEPVAADLSLVGHELTHSAPKTMVSNQAVFRFRWTAPASNRTVILFAAGNSTDGKHTLLGDNASSASLFVKVVNGVPPPVLLPPKTATPIALEPYVSGFNLPLVITHTKDSRLFIAESPGLVRIAKGTDNLLPTPFLDITDRVFGSPGLMGLAFHPNYMVNGYFYVRYISVNSVTGLVRSRISRFQRS